MECSLCGKEIHQLSKARSLPMGGGLEMVACLPCMNTLTDRANKAFDPKPEPIKKASPYPSFVEGQRAVPATIKASELAKEYIDQNGYHWVLGEDKQYHEVNSGKR